jgi:hypothetical protein
MTVKEKSLVATFSVMLAVTLGYFGVQKMLLAKGREYDDTRNHLGNDLKAQQRENGQAGGADRTLRGWTALTFDMDELRASARLRACLAALVERAGLSAEKLSLQPVRGAQLRGTYKELGWTIRVHGKLQHAVDFLYLLEQERHLHRLDNISINPLPATNEVDLQVRYLTLVVDSKPSEKLLADRLPTTAPTNLESDSRKLFDAIAARDLFRPYIQRHAAPPEPAPVVAAPPERRVYPPAPVPSPSPTRFRVVGLPDWHGRYEVLVSDRATGSLRSYQVGDALAGGTIAMVDYRPMPSALNPQILSSSRVIVKVGPDFWAIELGQDIAQKRRLTREQLPEPLRGAPQTAPADMVKKNVLAER